MSARRALGLLLAAPLLLGACTRGSTSSRPPIHLNPNMDDQPRVEAQAASAFFADGKAMRRPVPGTIARGELVADPAFATGMSAGQVPVDRAPIAIDAELLARGAERYAIYCAPCHGDDGSGQSMLRERAGVATADLAQDRLVFSADGYLYEVIANGFGLMPGYAYPIPPRDRWAIVAHVRELQRSAAAAGRAGAGAETGTAGAAGAAGAGEGDAAGEPTPGPPPGETPVEMDSGGAPGVVLEEPEDAGADPEGAER